MPRAYLRVDPNIDQHPDPLGMILLLCAGARQAERGRFRDRAVLDRTLGRGRAKAMAARGDVAPLADGRVLIVGWDEWQEGDYTVGERMRRMRARRSKAVSPVTPVASPDRNAVTTDASSSSPSSSSYLGDGDEISPPPQVGRRKDGANPRAKGTNPRAQGTSPRQRRQAAKRGGGETLAAILVRSNALGRKSA